MRKNLALFLVAMMALTMVFAAVGCGGSTTEQTTTEAPPAEAPPTDMPMDSTAMPADTTAMAH